MFVILLGMLLGGVLGVYIARNIVVDQVKRSNDFGDSKAEFGDFADKPKVEITCSKNLVDRSVYMNRF